MKSSIRKTLTTAVSMMFMVLVLATSAQATLQVNITLLDYDTNEVLSKQVIVDNGAGDADDTVGKISLASTEIIPGFNVTGSGYTARLAGPYALTSNSTLVQNHTKRKIKSVVILSEQFEGTQLPFVRTKGNGKWTDASVLNDYILMRWYNDPDNDPPPPIFNSQAEIDAWLIDMEYDQLRLKSYDSPGHMQSFGDPYQDYSVANEGQFSLHMYFELVLSPESQLHDRGQYIAALPTGCSGTIGDYVWFDKNYNGIQDPDEQGINDVTLTLSSSGVVIDTTKTITKPGTLDQFGYYQFTGVCPGSYKVTVETPAGYIPTLTGKGTYMNDSNPSPTTVAITTLYPDDPNTDFGFWKDGNPPKWEFRKLADPLYLKPGEQVSYTYEAKNTGGVPITGINIVDDNGTPNDPSDDFSVWTNGTLAVGETKTLTVTKLLPQTECMTINGQTVVVGKLYTTVLASGDVEVKYVQFNVNDNRYGSGATAATGWPSGHTFGNLTGSDKAQFQFTDKSGAIVLDFYLDYISQTTVSSSFPSGYGSLGVSGGDGKMVTGNAGWILSYTTSLSDNLNKSPFITGYTVNSPQETLPLSGVSVPAGWDYMNSYTVVVSKAAFGSSGFGGVTVPSVHDSPPKLGTSNLITPKPCDACVTNVANATGTAQTGSPGTPLQATASAKVCIGEPPPPGMTLVKTPDKTMISPTGESVTYSYVVTNTGAVPLSTITVVDDNGTPDNPSDDFTVGTIGSLAPQESQTLTWTKLLVQPQQPQTLCMTINGESVVVGKLYTSILPSGDIQVKYDQYNVNDNRYGTGATAATGWPSGHKFGDLTGSDKAQFQFRDSKGNLVLDFYSDYITASAAFPSGYGCLGVSGGDGSMVTGSAANISSITTSLSENLKLSQFQTGFTVNSPPETAPLSGISTPAGWDYTNSYTVVVKQSAFGLNGFGSVTVPGVHDSPPKVGSSNLITPTPCNLCVTNVANAVGTAQTTPTTQVAANNSATVCFGTSCVSVDTIKFDRNKVKVTLTNASTSPATFSSIYLGWPTANGKFKKVKVEGVGNVWDGTDVPAPGPVTLSGLANNTIAAGATIVLTFEFEKDVSKIAANYQLSIDFGSCTVTVF